MPFEIITIVNFYKYIKISYLPYLKTLYKYGQLEKTLN